MYTDEVRCNGTNPPGMTVSKFGSYAGYTAVQEKSQPPSHSCRIELSDCNCVAVQKTSDSHN